jgi:hypothetical protein
MADKSSWAISMKKILTSCNLQEVWDTKNAEGMSSGAILQIVEEDLMQKFQNTVKDDIESTSKLRYYKDMKSTYGTEDYIYKCRSQQHRSVIAKMRSGTYRLQVELGRSRKIPRDQRLCRKCSSGSVEDEIHFMFSCDKYSDQRKTLFEKLQTIIQDFNTKASREKLTLLLSSPKLLHHTVNFIITTCR